jgi:penicillin-binding protein 1C
MSLSAKRIAVFGALAIVACAVLLRLAPHRPLSSYAATSTAVYADGGELLRLTLAADQQYRLWTPLSQVSPDYLNALLLHEDRHFRWHFGVNPVALVRAAARTGSGGVRQGGSTITMQLARLLYHLNTRSVGGKLRQSAWATWLECRYSKDEILEAYVNLTPYGGNVQGVGAASLIYFGKAADRLTFAEALALAAIPQAPRSRGPVGTESAALRAARVRLVRDWAQVYPTPAEAIASASRPLQIRGLQQLPFEAPHFVEGVLASDGIESEIHTTLDVSLQRLLERAINQYIGTVSNLGVTNAAALLLDTRSMAVRALVGSANYHDASIDGQVNGATAKRSPGSALKPFIYGLAMDQGLIHTQSVLKDAPTAFGTYAPENFDGNFVGPVSAHDALIASRNVPAVLLSSQLAQPSLYQFLQAAGVSRLASEKHYGLALALGGGEVTMEEMASLYAMLANGGRFAPIRYLAGTTTPGSVRLLSPEAAFMVLSVLGDNPRPDSQPNVRPRVAWKTGTSWGFRDAWSVGIVGPYVLVVWVGNFDGSSNAAFVGAQIAAPLFFRIVDGVRASYTWLPDPTLQPPAGVARVEVCAASGDLPNADCPQRTLAWYIPGKSPIRVSSVHRRLVVDIRTGLRACADTPPQFARSEVFEFWSSDIQRLFARAGMPRRRPPEDRCSAAPLGASVAVPSIVSPMSGATYQLRQSSDAPEAPESLQLNATAGPEIESLYWFADGAFLGKSRPSIPLSWMPAHTGEFAVSVVDDHGATATRTVRVAALP